MSLCSSSIKFRYHIFYIEQKGKRIMAQKMKKATPITNRSYTKTATPREELKHKKTATPISKRKKKLNY